MSTQDFSRVHEMTSAELVRWSFILARCAGIEARLSDRGPDAQLTAAQEALKAEIDKRTSEGTG